MGAVLILLAWLGLVLCRLDFIRLAAWVTVLYINDLLFTKFEVIKNIQATEIKNKHFLQDRLLNPLCGLETQR